MQADPKPNPPEEAAAPAIAPESPAVSDSRELQRTAHASPARALQARLIRELGRARQPWLWHSTGLALALLLSLWAAGFMLNAAL